MSRCTRCHKLKSTAAFYTDHRTICKGCLVHILRNIKRKIMVNVLTTNKYYQKIKTRSIVDPGRRKAAIFVKCTRSTNRCRDHKQREVLSFKNL